MKRSVKNSIKWSLILLSVIAFCSCDKGDSYIPADYRLAVPSQDASPDGNMLSYMNGNVNLDILPGAVSGIVRFTVNECQSGTNCNFALKVISIEPLMTFNVPVNVSLKYDGELANPEVSIEGCRLCIYSWEKRECLYNGVAGKMCCCTINENDRTINFRISQTGVFAVGMIPLENSDY